MRSRSSVDASTYTVPYPPAVEAWAKGRRAAELERAQRRVRHAELAELLAPFVVLPDQAMAAAGELLDRFDVLHKEQQGGGRMRYLDAAGSEQGGGTRG